jgi:hypothetical protein
MPIDITIAIATGATFYGQPIQTEPNQTRYEAVLFDHRHLYRIKSSPSRKLYRVKPHKMPIVIAVKATHYDSPNHTEPAHRYDHRHRHISNSSRFTRPFYSIDISSIDINITINNRSMQNHPN